MNAIHDADVVVETHRHQCSSCLVVWEHGGDCKGSVEAHMCPICGLDEREWYEGAITPTFIGDCSQPNHRAVPLT